MIKITVTSKKGAIWEFDNVISVQVGGKIYDEYSGSDIANAPFNSNEDLTITFPSGVHFIAAGTIELLTVQDLN